MKLNFKINNSDKKIENDAITSKNDIVVTLGDQFITN